MATNTNKNAKIREAEQLVDEAAAQLELARQALRRASCNLDMKQPECEVITFKLQHDRGGRTYSYAALNTGGRWFTTGSTCPKGGYRWGELVEIINEAHALVGTVERYNSYDLPF